MHQLHNELIDHRTHDFNRNSFNCSEHYPFWIEQAAAASTPDRALRHFHPWRRQLLLLHLIMR